MSKEVVLLEDDDSDGDDVQEIVAAAPTSSSSNHHVVDLTSALSSGAAKSSSSLTASRRRTSNNNVNVNEGRRKSRNSIAAHPVVNEVEFVGSKRQSSNNNNNNNNSGRSISNDDVQFAGVKKRPRPSAANNNTFSRQYESLRHNDNLSLESQMMASARNNLNGEIMGHNNNERYEYPRIGGGIFNNFTGSGSATTSYLDSLLGMGGASAFGGIMGNIVGNVMGRGYNRYAASAAAASSSNGGSQRKSKSTSKAPAKKEEPTAMQKGKSMQKPQGFDALDMFYPRLKANERTLILHNLLLQLRSSTSTLQHSTYTKKFVHDWRVKFEKNNAKATLWELAKNLSDEITSNDGNQKMPSSNGGKENKQNTTTKNGESDIEDVTPPEEKKATLPIGPISGDTLDTLSKYFIAHYGKSKHKSMLDEIQPCQSQNGLSCSICADDFDAGDTVACGGEDIHFYCRPCLHSYCTLTVESGPIQTMTCPLPSCKSLFATGDIKSTLSEWDVLMIEHREESRDRRVAMAAKAMLHCECGVVAVITEEDMGDGRITCPGEGCGKRFCAKCGNDDHSKDPCPPPAETVQWLSKHCKPCPNCK